MARPALFTAHVVEGARPGRRLLITAGVHGDGLEPMAAVERLARSIKPTNLAGTLTLIPVVIEGALARPPRSADDRLDLARSCPGDRAGPITQRVAAEFASPPTDCHASDQRKRELTQAAVDLYSKKGRMIFDHLSKSETYEGINDRMRRAFEFLKRTDLASLPLGKHLIHGEDVYALIQAYDTKPSEGAKWEAHRKYIDVQYLMEGAERMGYGHIDNFRIIKDYDPAGDYLLFSGQGNEVILLPGNFAIFFPHDVHRPTIAVHEPLAVKKVVVKVRA